MIDPLYRHDPDAPGALLMKAPTKEHKSLFNKKYVYPTPTLSFFNVIPLRNLPVIPVVLDPILVRHLRPHQIEGQLRGLSESQSLFIAGPLGVRFLYECVMSMRKHEGQGCILADEMYNPSSIA